MAPAVTTTPDSASTGSEQNFAECAAMAARSSGTPAAGQYCWAFSRRCFAATSLIFAGPSTSGNPCPRLTQSCLAERADIVVKMVVPDSPKAGDKGGGREGRSRSEELVFAIV